MKATDPTIKKLTAIKKRDRLSDIAIAKELGIERQTIWRYINGLSKPNRIYRTHIEKWLKQK